MPKIKYDGFGKTVSDEHRTRQFNKLIELITTHFTGSRRTGLIQLYTDLRDRVLVAPASGRVQYHNAYPGGYLDHIHNVIFCSELVAKTYQHINGHIDFTDEERIFAAMHHDLGKLGTLTQPYYILETDQRQILNGSVYKYNDALPPMTVADRTFDLLQLYGIKTTYNERIGIQCADGLYDESNKTYFMAKGDFAMSTNIHLIMHWADHMAANSEKDEMKLKYLG